MNTYQHTHTHAAVTQWRTRWQAMLSSWFARGRAPRQRHCLHSMRPRQITLDRQTIATSQISKIGKPASFFLTNFKSKRYKFLIYARYYYTPINSMLPEEVADPAALAVQLASFPLAEWHHTSLQPLHSCSSNITDSVYIGLIDTRQ